MYLCGISVLSLGHRPSEDAGNGRRVSEHNGQARRQIRHDAEFGATSPRIPHVKPQSEKNKKCDSTRDGDVGRALAAPGRERSFELREVRERAEYLCGNHAIDANLRVKIRF